MSRITFSGECPYCYHSFKARADSNDLDNKQGKLLCPSCNKMSLIESRSGDYVLIAEPANKPHTSQEKHEETEEIEPENIEHDLSLSDWLSFVSMILIGVTLISIFSVLFADYFTIESVHNKVLNAFSGSIFSIIFAVIIGGIIGAIATALIAHITDSEHNNIANLFGGLLLCFGLFGPVGNIADIDTPQIEPIAEQRAESVTSTSATNNRCVGNCENGQGTYTWDDGGSHSGVWLNGEKHGYGTSKWANGNKYQGQWQNGKKHGHGTKIWTNGDKYEGQWQYDKYHGQGTLTWSEGENYRGSWANDNQHGYGVYSWPSGSSYAGQWRDGEKHGSGIYTWADGDKEHGEWRNGERID